MAKNKKTTLLPASKINFTLVGLMCTVLVFSGIALQLLAHASTTDSFTNNYLSVTPLTVGATLDRENPNTALMVADHSGYTQGMLYGKGFSITSTGATGYQIRSTAPTQGVGFYESSGGMTSGQTAKIHTYINPNKPNGTYTGSAVVSYYAPDKQAWLDGPTVNYTITLVDYVYTDYLTVKPLNISESLSRMDADPASGLIYGKSMAITPKTATGFQIKYTAPTQGVGYYESSGGLVAGAVATVRTYVNPSKPNGTYTGSAILQFYAPDKQAWLDGPTVSYTITLKDSVWSDFFSAAPLNVNVTLSRANAGGGALVYGPGFTLTNKTAGAFQLKYTAPTQGQGFAISSGGLTPGVVVNDQAYINASKPNGAYTGSAVLQYIDPTTGLWRSGPTIKYSITLTN